MLESTKIQRRQSEVRQQLAALAGKEKPSEDELRSMSELDKEYGVLEQRYRASLIAEDTERREAKDELETRSDREFGELIDKFELRQVASFLDTGDALSGPTAEVVSELRAKHGFRGVPVPYAAFALERRAGETIASGVFDPKRTMPVLDRLFPSAAASKMGASIINIDSGLVEWPVVTSAVEAGWATTETGNVAGPTVFGTTDKALAPNNTLGVTMTVTRKALKQSGAALEQAVRRDLNAAIAAKLDQAVFLGLGTDGEPLGVIPGAVTYGIESTAINAAASWSAFRAAVIRFMTANAADGPGAVRLLIRPEVYGDLDGALVDGTAVSEWDRLVKNIPAGNIAMSSNALPDPAGSPSMSVALLTVAANGVAPIFVGLWGAVDLIRDVYTLAPSGGLKLTSLVTADVTAPRGAQLELLTGIQ
jgi:HK97 family phage major capsid protein